MGDEKKRFDPAEFMRTVHPFGHGGSLNIGYVGHDADWIELSLPYDPGLASDAETGVLASGPIVALMDMASGVATWMRAGWFTPTATLDLRVDYLRPARVGQTVIARATCYKMTRRIAFIRGIAHDGDPDDPIAHVASTFMLTSAA